MEAPAGVGQAGMTGLERALAGIVSYLEERRIPYMVIGGIANLAWGVPRTTRDIDVTLWVPGQEEATTTALCAAFEVLVKDPQGFVVQTRVLPLKVEGFKVDVIFGLLPYEESAVRRARFVEMAGLSVRVASPEDLVLHKIISDRPRDIEDVRGIVEVQGRRLDRPYLDARVLALALELGRPEIKEHYLSLWRDGG